MAIYVIFSDNKFCTVYRILFLLNNTCTTGHHVLTYTCFLYDCVACTSSDLFNCPNTYRCIKKSQQCNGRDECGDWADEKNCGE